MNTPKTIMENKWEKCWKINCSPPLEVYKTHINYFGSNVDIENIDKMIEDNQRNIEFLKESKEI